MVAVTATTAVVKAAAAAAKAKAEPASYTPEHTSESVACVHISPRATSPHHQGPLAFGPSAHATHLLAVKTAHAPCQQPPPELWTARMGIMWCDRWVESRSGRPDRFEARTTHSVVRRHRYFGTKSTNSRQRQARAACITCPAAFL